MIRSSSERIKNTIKETANFKSEIEGKVKDIVNNDEPFFEALLLYAEGIRMTFNPEESKKLEGKARDISTLYYVEMIYAILYTLEKSGFIQIASKTNRIANDVFDEYIKNL